MSKRLIDPSPYDDGPEEGGPPLDPNPVLTVSGLGPHNSFVGNPVTFKISGFPDHDLGESSFATVSSESNIILDLKDYWTYNAADNRFMISGKKLQRLMEKLPLGSLELMLSFEGSKSAGGYAMLAMGRGVSIAGRLVTPEGNPVTTLGGKKVLLEGQNNHLGEVATVDNSGNFSFVNVIPDTYALTLNNLEYPNSAVTNVLINPGTTKLEISMVYRVEGSSTSNASTEVSIPGATVTQAQEMRLTIDLPECHMQSRNIFPAKYSRLAKKEKDFAWILQATSEDRVVSGGGWERVEGSSIRDWFTFYLVDINNDGDCDWYVDASQPISTGGDRDSINTIYLGRKDGWERIGAWVPDNKPDTLGFGKTNEEQGKYLFGEGIAVIHDEVERINYVVTAFYDRHEKNKFMPGYWIMTWDGQERTLRVLDKWQTGSKAAKVYAFFKAHGARSPGKKTANSEDNIFRFDPEIEAAEIEQACNADSRQGDSPGANGRVDPATPAYCKH